MPIKILNWNIEQFGGKRSKMTHRLYSICEVVAAVNAHIVSLIEIKTTNTIEAGTIADLITQRLANTHNINYNYILSYHNNMEIHVFLYKTNAVEPVCLGTAQRQVYDSTSIANATFSRSANAQTTINNNSGILTNHFPLMEYNNIGNSRPLAAAFFAIPNTTFIFCLMAWHNMAGKRNNSDRPYSEMNELRQTNYVANQQITISIANNKVQIGNIIISGDFNVDYLDDEYVGVYNAFNNYAIGIQDQYTMLGEYIHNKKYSERNDACSALFDNFITCGFTNINLVADVVDTLTDCLNKNWSKLLANRYANAASDVMIEFAFKFVENFLKNDDNPSLPTEATETLLLISIAYCYSNKRINNQFEKEQYQRLQRFNISLEDFNEFAKQLKNGIMSKEKSFTRAYQIAANIEKPGWGDALMLHTNTMSDHLPVIFTIG